MKKILYTLLKVIPNFFTILVLSGSIAMNLAGPLPRVSATETSHLELIGNGDFEETGEYWSIVGTGSRVAENAINGSSAVLEGIMENRVNLYQPIHVPPDIVGAALSFTYQIIPIPNTYTSGSAQLYAEIASETETIVNLFQGSVVYSDTGLETVAVEADASGINAILSALNRNQTLYLNFIMLQEPANAFRVTIDDISLMATRTTDSANGVDSDDAQTVGRIAYIGLDANGYGHAVNIIDPSGKTEQTVWTEPESIVSPKLSDVAWRPDGMEIAFVSDHESEFSPFHSDIYAIQADGSGLRKITNPPIKSAIDSGKYDFGTVKGSIYNEYGDVPVFLLYIEGAQASEALSIGGYQSEIPFTVSNVADLGPGVLQTVVFSWGGNDSCANGKEYAFAVVDVIPGQAVDVGTIEFHGYCNHYMIGNISFKPDGSEIAFTIEGLPRKVAVTGQSIGTDLFTPSGTAYDISWSPTGDRFLYRSLSFSDPSGIHLSSAGGGAGQALVTDYYSLFETPVWLPNGTGFVFCQGNNIFQYDMETGTTTQLTNYTTKYAKNPSLSPDGADIVFELTDYQTYDLWIMDRKNPADIRRLTSDGISANPSWGKPSEATADSSVELVLNVQAEGTWVTLSWTEIPNVNGYRLYFAPYPDPGSDIGSIDLGMLSTLRFDGKGLALFVAVQPYDDSLTTAQISNIGVFDLR